MIRVTTWLNTVREAMVVGYRDGDVMHAAWTGYRGEPPNTEPEVWKDLDLGATLEAVWAQHNHDDRPGGSVFRSLSIGDVVSVAPFALEGHRRARYFAVKATGFEEVGPVLPDEVSTP